jgi:hypothetical protein
MKTKIQTHTPGPWRVERLSGPYDVSIAITAEGVELASLEGSRDPSKRRAEGWQQEDEAMANARLIAAAPDLLEAAKNMDDVLSRWSVANMRPEKAGAFNAALTALRAAIAKAEGGPA